MHALIPEKPVIGQELGGRQPSINYYFIVGRQAFNQKADIFNFIEDY